jgi:murein L,D-transpeptidase YafK
MKYRACVLLGIVILSIGAWSAWPDTPLPLGSKVDLIVVRKAARQLELYRGGQLVKVYAVSLGRHPLDRKERQGDGRTPEGDYRLDYRNANSSFHEALHISYPDSVDLSAARARGVDAGGLVMIHGMKNGWGWLGRLHRLVDWTDGCVAVTDREMDEIWRVVPDGTRIVLKP